MPLILIVLGIVLVLAGAWAYMRYNCVGIYDYVYVEKMDIVTKETTDHRVCRIVWRNPFGRLVSEKRDVSSSIHIVELRDGNIFYAGNLQVLWAHTIEQRPGYIYALRDTDQRDPEFLWQRQLYDADAKNRGDQVENTAPITTEKIELEDGKLKVYNDDGWVYTLDPKTGKKLGLDRWRTILH